MIEISLGKLVLLAVVALIVLGPEKLPGAARTAGAMLRRVRSGWDNVRAEVERELEIEEIRRAARETVARAEAAQAEAKSTMQQARESIEQTRNMVQSDSTSAAETLPAEQTLPADPLGESAVPPESALPVTPAASVSDEQHIHGNV